MKKNASLAGIILLVSMVMYNVAAFVLVTDYNAKFWCGYCFTMAAFLLQIVFAFIAFGKADTLKKTFFGIPIAQLGLTYLILQIILGFVVIFVPGLNAAIGAVISTVLLGVYIIAITMAVGGREIAVATEEKVQKKVFYIKSLLADVETMGAKATDAQMRKSLKAVEDAIRYSDPMSNDALATIEFKIEAKVAELGEAVDAGSAEQTVELCKAIGLLFVERNSKCKLLK